MRWREDSSEEDLDQQQQQQQSLTSEEESELDSDASLSDLEKKLPPYMVRAVKSEVKGRLKKERMKKLKEQMSLEEEVGIVTNILKPVCLTMVLVIIAVKLVDIPNAAQPVYFVYHEEATDSGGIRLIGAFLNALITVLMILAMTGLFVCLYYYRCLKLIFGWLIFSSWSMLAIFGGFLLYLILSAWNFPMDNITYWVILWNFSTIGIMAIFWYAPPLLNKAYLIIISTLMAIFFTRLPEWTTWTILLSVAIYDLFAVLCPGGPLKLLVELAQERNEPIPALLYNGSASVSPDTDFGIGSFSAPIPSSPPLDEIDILDEDKEQEQEAQEQEENMPSRSVKLGLGDFVFYSVLVGRAASYDIITVFNCFVGIVAGLFATLVLLAIYERALPALPISIFLGMGFFFISRVVVVPCVLVLGVDGVVL